MKTFALILLLAAAALGAEPPAPQPALSEPQLRHRLADIDKELAAEGASLEAARAHWAQQITDKTAGRQKLAAQLLALEIERQKLTAAQQQLATEQRQSAAEARRAADAVDSVRAAALSLADQLLVQLGEVPGSEHASAEMQRISDNLRRLDASAAAQALRPLAPLADATHADATRLTLNTATIWNAAGAREQVKLLKVGHIAYAYRAGEGPAARFALALRSPADASGYRWSEQLPDDVRRTLTEVFTAAPTASPRTVVVPLDITGRLRAESMAVQEDLADVIRSGGPIMIPIGAVGLLAVLLTIERFWTLYLRNTLNPRRVRLILQAARDGRFDEAQRLAASGGGAVSRVLAACLRRRPAGQHAMEDSIQEQLLAETPRLQKFLGGLAMLAAASPLLGLLGTVTGIIQTFAAVKAFGNANPGYMAGGISEALVTTAGGLIIAIPTLLLAGVLRGRVERLTAEAEKHAATLLNILSHDQPAAAVRPQPAEEAMAP